MMLGFQAFAAMVVNALSQVDCHADIARTSVAWINQSIDDSVPVHEPHAHIADGINQGRIKRAVVSYPTRMQTLAGKIHDYLQQQTKQTIAMKSVELKDTDQVKYNLKQVIVTLYFN